ncbi:MAG TPA: helix-turn-helix domain-containing protein [Dehalococcoidia bacterium]|nr:helix-turn-helix domain-containing protein [Dehalococcoidia bacterium]
MVSRQTGRLLTLEEAAAHFRVSVSTLYRWCRAGRIPAFKIGRGWLVPMSAFVTASPRSRDALWEFLARAFGPRSRARGQHWVVCADRRSDHEELVAAIEEFVLSRRKSRLGRVWWEEGPDVASQITDKPGGFEVRLQAPAEAAGDRSVLDALESALRSQAGRAQATYVLVTAEVAPLRRDVAALNAIDDVLQRVSREHRMVIFSGRVMGDETPWTALAEMAGRYDGVICCAQGNLYTASGRIIGGR